MKSDRATSPLRRRFAAAALLLPLAASAAPGDGLRDTLDRTRDVIAGSGDTLRRLDGNLGALLGSATGRYVEPTPGTVLGEGYVEHEGLARRFLVIRPQNVQPGAPVLVLLHARGLSPETMANLTRAGRLAASEGAWVYLPAAVDGSWNDSPANRYGRDDVGFIAKLIDGAVAGNRLDARRVYAAGYSNGGFMAERLACELSTRIAGIAAVAATLRDAQVPACRLAHPMPVALFDGTADAVVPYKGIPTLAGAMDAAAFWAQADGCTQSRVTTTLPDLAPSDGTRVTLTRYVACPTTADVRLYTIEGGGHTWPGSPDAAFTFELGRTSQDIDATYALWRVLIPFARP